MTQWIYSRLATLMLLFLVVAACSSDERQMGAFTLAVTESGQAFEVRDGDRVLLRSDTLPIERLRFTAHARMRFGLFSFEQNVTSTTRLTGVRIGKDGVLDIGEGALRLIPHDEGDRLRLDVEPGSRADGWRFRFDCTLHDEFMGFGEQYSFLTMKGRRVPIWTEENGLGRAPGHRVPPRGDLFASYYPMPYFLDPRGMGFVSDSSAYQEFLLCENSDVWSVEVWDDRPFSLQVLRGPEPMDVISQLTEITGRPVPIPDWGWNLWLAAQGGDDQVREVLDHADAAGIPYSAIWVQDWVGQREFAPGLWGVKYRWKEDPDFYTDLRGLIADVHSRGKKFLGYFNPFIPPEFEQEPNSFYVEGSEEGYLIQDADGEPFDFVLSVFESSLVDLTNPAAVDWFKEHARVALDLGMDGWMADFGEWLPWDAQLHEGISPYVHNIYPELWHRANLEVLQEKRPDGDFILLTRSGHLHSAGVNQVVWAGDQEAEWDIYDGLPTALKANVSHSLSGVPFVTHDIAGFSGGPSTKELWQRWVEFGAFTPIMRLHDGLQKLENWHFMRDEESAAFLKRFATIHNLLTPYLMELAELALEKGYPLVRHPLLIENTPALREVDDQYFLGPDLLVAPVLTPETESRSVRFPAGRWRPIFGGEVVVGPTDRDIHAPIGSPPIFAREDSTVDGLLATLP